jgi:hypothetical protein
MLAAALNLHLFVLTVALLGGGLAALAGLHRNGHSDASRG